MVAAGAVVELAMSLSGSRSHNREAEEVDAEEDKERLVGLGSRHCCMIRVLSCERAWIITVRKTAFETLYGKEIGAVESHRDTNVHRMVSLGAA